MGLCIGEGKEEKSVDQDRGGGGGLLLLFFGSNNDLRRWGLRREAEGETQTKPNQKWSILMACLVLNFEHCLAFTSRQRTKKYGWWWTMPTEDNFFFFLGFKFFFFFYKVVSPSEPCPCSAMDGSIFTSAMYGWTVVIYSAERNLSRLLSSMNSSDGDIRGQ